MNDLIHLAFVAGALAAVAVQKHEVVSRRVDAGLLEDLARGERLFRGGLRFVVDRVTDGIHGFHLSLSVFSGIGSSNWAALTYEALEGVVFRWPKKEIFAHRISTASAAFMNEEMEHFRDVDWIEVHERLTLVALRMFEASQFADDERVLESFGVGFEDLPQDLITKILDPEYPKLTWNAAVRGPATTLEVAKFLSKVLQNDFLDMVRAKRSKRQDSLHVPTDGDDVRLQIDPPDPAPAIDDDVLHRLTFAPLRKRLDDDFLAHPDDDLQLYVMLQFDDDRYVPYKPQDAAKELGVDVKRIYLLKEKFERRLHRLFKKELEALGAENRETLHDQAR